MDCSGCGKEDLQDYEQYSINDTWYYLCLDGDNSCENRVKQAILRTIHVLREQHGITLFDNGVPMNPQIGGAQIDHIENWVDREISQPEAFFDQVDKFLCNLVGWLLDRLEPRVISCVNIISRPFHKLRSLNHLVRKKFGRHSDGY